MFFTQLVNVPESQATQAGCLSSQPMLNKFQSTIIRLDDMELLFFYCTRLHKDLNHKRSGFSDSETRFRQIMASLLGANYDKERIEEELD